MTGHVPKMTCTARSAACGPQELRDWFICSFLHFFIESMNQ
jgi:hypothetical protein